MKWINPNRDSSNIEDRRGKRIGGKAAMGGGGMIVVIILYLLFGRDFSPVVNQLNLPDALGVEETDSARRHEHQELMETTTLVFNSCNDVWEKLYPQATGQAYEAPKLVVYTDAVQSGCGSATREVGPFYCPADEKVYIDLSFFLELANRFQAPGELAMAYVTAHEVGHHIQSLLGLSDKMQQLRQKLSTTEYNKYSVRLELNADYLAGVWAHHVQKMGIAQAEEGEYEEALTAAAAIGDDTLQKKAQGYAQPETFTHGTSQQRMQAFAKGYRDGSFTGQELRF